MEKYIKISIFTLLISSILIYSCSENSDLNTMEENQNEVIFEDVTLKDNVSPNFYDNHFYLIEKLGNNAEKEMIIAKLQDNSIELKNLNMDIIKKFYLNNSDINMFSIPFMNSENMVIIYQFDNTYQVSVAEYNKLDKFNEFKLKTLDNKLYYSVEINDQNQIGGIVIADNDKIADFSNEVYNISTEKHNSLNHNSNNSQAKSGCCRQQSGWSDCMDCTVSYCGSKWWCVAGLVAAGPEVLAAFGASCIGAGPNASC
ncbi:hypothetical protein [Winogradskyella sp. PC D3.3]